METIRRSLPRERDDAIMNVPSKTPRAIQFIAATRSVWLKTPMPTISVAPRTAAEGLWNLSHNISP